MTSGAVCHAPILHQMKNFVIQCVLGGITEMNTHFVCSRPDPPVQNGGIFALNCADKFLPFLRLGRNSNRFGFVYESSESADDFPPTGRY